MSMNPGETILPFASIVFVLAGAARFLPIFLILPSSIKMSAFSSMFCAGSMTCPFFMSRVFGIRFVYIGL